MNKPTQVDDVMPLLIKANKHWTQAINHIQHKHLFKGIGQMAIAQVLQWRADFLDWRIERSQKRDPPV